ncbi:MAG: hypothetical protein L0216_19705, partial [Planctomycetales bacterium]|nr:hypothetical protein [Planctomycetales bacterium]
APAASLRGRQVLLLLPVLRDVGEVLLAELREPLELTERLSAAEEAERRGDGAGARTLCEEVLVMAGVLTREMSRAVGRDPAGPRTAPALAEGIGEAVAESLRSGPAREVVSAVARTALEAALPEILRSPAGQAAVKSALDKWAAELRAEFTGLAVAAASGGAPGPPAAPGPTIEEVRAEIAKALAARGADPPPAPGSTAAPADVGALLDSPKFKEFLEEKMNWVVRYLKNDVLPHELDRRLGKSGSGIHPAPG